MTLEELQVKVTAKTDGIESKLRGLNSKLSETGNVSNKVSSKVSGAFKAIDAAIKASMIGAIIGVIAKVINAIGGFVGACTELGSDVTEVQNVVDTTFGEMASKVDEFASNSIKSLGMSETACKKYTSTLGAILKSTGFNTGDALQMSETLTQLTADMASFYNLDNESMFEKIRSGITGETEPLKQLGINMSVANLEAYALSQGIKKSYDKMSQSEQTLLRYNYLLSVTGDAQGDLARTSDSWANQTRLLSEQWNQLKTNLGKGFINILTPIVKWLNIILEKLQAVGEWFARVTGMVFGDASSDSVGGNSLIDTSLYDNAADAAGGLGDAIDDTGDSAKKAGKKAADAKKGLLSFDEINQLNDSSGSGSGGSESGTGDKAEDVGNALGDVGNNADKLSNKVGNLSKATDGWLDKMLEKLEEIAGKIADIISALLSIKPDMGINWDSNKSKNTEKNNEKNETVNKIVNYISNYDDYSANKCLRKVEDLKKQIDSILSKPAYVTVIFEEGALLSRMQAIQTTLNTIKDKTIRINVITNGNGIDSLINKLNLLGTSADALNNGPLKRLWEFIKNSFKLDISLAFDLIANNGQTAFKNLSSFINSCKKTGEEVGNFFKNVFTGNFSGAFDNVKNTGSIWKEHIINCFRNVKDNCASNTEALRNWVVGKWENLKTLVTGHSNSMKTTTTSDTSTMKAKFTDLGSYVSGTFATKIGSGCTSISSKFSSMWSSIKSGCTSALNYMIDKINGLTSKLNSKLNFTLPSVLGGGHVGFNIPQIPRLARGGIVDGATFMGNYIAGEAGKEMIVPLENTSFVSKLAASLGNAVMNAMSISMSYNQGNNSTQDATMELDGTVFARLIVPYVMKEMRRVGVQID